MNWQCEIYGTGLFQTILYLQADSEERCQIVICDLDHQTLLAGSLEDLEGPKIEGDP